MVFGFFQKKFFGGFFWKYFRGVRRAKPPYLRLSGFRPRRAGKRQSRRADCPTTSRRMYTVLPLFALPKVRSHCAGNDHQTLPENPTESRQMYTDLSLFSARKNDRITPKKHCHTAPNRYLFLPPFVAAPPLRNRRLSPIDAPLRPNEYHFDLLLNDLLLDHLLLDHSLLDHSLLDH